MENNSQQITLTDMEIATIHGVILENTTPSNDCKPVGYRICKTETEITIYDSDGEVTTINISKPNSQ